MELEDKHKRNKSMIYSNEKDNSFQFHEDEEEA